MTLIDRQADLDTFCAEVASSDFIAVDTEFMRDATYWSRLCLIQIAGTDRAAAVDALADGIDLAPIWDLLAKRDLLKVMHAARQDIEIFFHQGNVIPEPLFDTQVGAMVCGFGEQIAYDALVSRFAGRRIDKQARFADWARRPLPRHLISYALADVTHLRQVHEGLTEILRRNGRADWVREEEAVLLDPATYRMEPEDAWRRIKSRSRDPAFLGRLRAVAAWRESEAQRLDVPRNRVMREDALLDVAAQAPADPEALARCRGVSRGLAGGARAAGLLRTLAAARDLSPDSVSDVPAGRGRPRGAGAAVELLRVLLKARCEAEGVAQKLVADAEELEALATGEADLRVRTGWRRAIFGADAERLLRGELALTLGGGRVVVAEVQ